MKILDVKWKNPKMTKINSILTKMATSKLHKGDDNLTFVSIFEIICNDWYYSQSLRGKQLDLFRDDYGIFPVVRMEQ